MVDKKQDQSDRNRKNTELILRTLEGDNTAFAELIEPYYKLYFSLALSYVHELEQAKDVVQEGLITMHSKLGTLRNPDKFVSWSYTIIRRKAIRVLRDIKSETKMKMKYSEMHVRNDAQRREMDDSKENGNQNFIKESIIKAISQLRVRYRQMIVLYYLEKMSIEDISIKLGISEMTANVRLYRARKKLRKVLRGII